MKRTLLYFTFILSISFSVNSQTTFNLTQTVSLTASDDPYAIATGLIDNDAYEDIVYASSGNGTFSLLKNDNTNPGTFLAPVTIGSGGYYYPNSVVIADIDGINGNDIIASVGDKVIWFANDGFGNFGTEQLVASFSSFGASFLVVKDIDGGGTLDVAVSDYYAHTLVWMSNSGSAPHFDGTKNTIVAGFTNVAGFDLGDIDGDTDIDAVVSNAISNDPNTIDSKIEVYYNDGSEVFTADANPLDVASDKDYVWSVVIADIDEDLNMDILSSDLYGSIVWYKRTETAPGTATYTANPIATSIANPATITFEDLDNDTKKDIVLSSGSSGAGNDIVWFRNLGSGTFDSESIIDATQSNTFTMSIADFDNDMDLDIASAAYNNDTIKVFDNQKIVLSVNNPTLNNLVKIYPNPTKNILNFKGLTENLNISVYDVLGKQVINTNLNINQSLDVSELNNGLYILKFEGHNSNFKFIKD